MFSPWISLVLSCVPLLLLRKGNCECIPDEFFNGNFLFIISSKNPHSFCHVLLRRHSPACGWSAGLMFNICFHLFLVWLFICKSWKTKRCISLLLSQLEFWMWFRFSIQMHLHQILEERSEVQTLLAFAGKCHPGVPNFVMASWSWRDSFQALQVGVWL